MHTKTCLVGLAALSVLLLAGCSHFVERRAQRDLEMVARRWSMTIRASQIIPIYPLNEDVQPGDVFVVETPAQRQAKDYDTRGYLDLEHLLVRLNPGKYSDFYTDGYGTKSNTNTPRHWQFPDSRAWSNAPLAGFPSYSIQVKNGGGFNAAFPISGIPVGLSLLDSAQANVTVQISRANTYGLDQATLDPLFEGWLKANPKIVLQYARPIEGNRTAYLRLVTRVFVASAVNVNVTGERATSFAGSGGAPKEVNLPMHLDTNAVANYTNVLGSLDRMFGTLAGSAPGGTLKFAGASSRSVSMNEEFKRPLVIGYIAQDYPILPDGRLGNPVSTKDVLEGTVSDPLSATVAKLQEEKKVAALIAEHCVAEISKLKTNELAVAIDLASRASILSLVQKSNLLAMVGTNSSLAIKELVTATEWKSRSGDVRARCDLLQFRDELFKR